MVGWGYRAELGPLAALLGPDMFMCSAFFFTEKTKG
jgi:hypothetical protein